MSSCRSLHHRCRWPSVGRAVFAVLIVASIAAADSRDTAPSLVVSQVGFGSCSRHTLDQSYWPYVTAALTTDEAPELYKGLLPAPTCRDVSRNRKEKRGDYDLPTNAVGARIAPGCVDGFVWLGDAIYGDNSPIYGLWFPASYSEMKKKFMDFRDNPHYARFVDTVRRYAPVRSKLAERIVDARSQFYRTPELERRGSGKWQHPMAGVVLNGSLTPPRAVVGVWDDHDMGKNNGGAEFEGRKANQQLFLDFLDIPERSPRRGRKGVYGAYGIPFRPLRDGAPAEEASLHSTLASAFDFATCTVLLDVRYFADPRSDLLGELQWDWLEDVLRGGNAAEAELGPSVTSPQRKDGGGKGGGKGGEKRLWERCLFTMIGSGIQVVSDEKPTEHWAQYPGARPRLLSLLRVLNAERFVFISGDVHMGEVQTVAPFLEAFAERPMSWGAGPLNIPIIDVTSSGMTHTIGSVLKFNSAELIFPSPRARERYLEKNFGSVTLTAKRLPTPRDGGPPATGANGGLSVNDIEVTASLVVHSVKDGAAAIRYDVNIFSDLTIPADRRFIAKPQFDYYGSPQIYLRAKERIERLRKRIADCPYGCDLSPVQIPLIKRLLTAIHKAMPVHVQLPTVIIMTVLFLLTCTCCFVGVALRYLSQGARVQNRSNTRGAQQNKKWL